MISFLYSYGILRMLRAKIILDDLIRLTASQHLLLIMLATCADKTGMAYPSQKELSEATGMTVSSVMTGLQRLEQAQLIESCYLVRRVGFQKSLPAAP